MPAVRKYKRYDLLLSKRELKLLTSRFTVSKQLNGEKYSITVIDNEDPIAREIIATRIKLAELRKKQREIKQAAPAAPVKDTAVRYPTHRWNADARARLSLSMKKSWAARHKVYKDAT